MNQSTENIIQVKKKKAQTKSQGWDYILEQLFNNTNWLKKKDFCISLEQSNLQN